jgi:dihydrofolate synthase / folylpolyglutamate synthase
VLGSEAIEQGLKVALVRGRFQVIPGNPGIVLDVAHNAAAVEVLAENLKRLPSAGQTRAVFGMMSDKDVESVVAILAPLIDSWYLADLGVSRGMATDQLADILLADAAVDSIAIKQYPNAASAFGAAVADASADDLILVFGSFWLIGSILEKIH